jgi:hypothetical protein
MPPTPLLLLLLLAWERIVSALSSTVFVTEAGGGGGAAAGGGGEGGDGIGKTEEVLIMGSVALGLKRDQMWEMEGRVARSGHLKTSSSGDTALL